MSSSESLNVSLFELTPEEKDLALVADGDFGDDAPEGWYRAAVPSYYNGKRVITICVVRDREGSTSDRPNREYYPVAMLVNTNWELSLIPNEGLYEVGNDIQVEGILNTVRGEEE